MQGSLLGILQHNVSLDSLDDGLEDSTSKYVDDMSVIEALDTRKYEMHQVLHGEKSKYKKKKSRVGIYDSEQ